VLTSFYPKAGAGHAHKCGKPGALLPPPAFGRAASGAAQIQAFLAQLWGAAALTHNLTQNRKNPGGAESI